MKVKSKVIGKDCRILTVSSITTIKDKDTGFVVSQTLTFSEPGVPEDSSSNYTVWKKRYTKENIKSLGKNEVFVFGSNTQGRHGAGAAKVAVDKFGAIYGSPSGLQGNSYALITTDLNPQSPKYSLESIQDNIEEFVLFARNNPCLTFLVTKVGTNLAGYTVKEIAKLFINCNNVLDIPYNVILPKEFEMRF